MRRAVCSWRPSLVAHSCLVPVDWCLLVGGVRYDQPVPEPGSSDHPGKGRSWAPGGYVEKGVGVWFRARVQGCDAASGRLEVVYDVDDSAASILLPLTFAHWGPKPPPGREARPDYLPRMALVGGARIGLPGGGGVCVCVRGDGVAVARIVLDRKSVV